MLLFSSKWRRLQASVAAVMILCASQVGVRAQIETVAAAISAIATIASFFGPKGNVDVKVLSAIADNIAEINLSLQNITREIAQLKDDVKELPDRILQHTMTVQITGRLQNTYELLHVLSNSPRKVERESIYRDLRRYYDSAKDLRADLFSSEMTVAERLALQIPLLYGVELASFNALNSIDLEDRDNDMNYAYYVHEELWRYALKQYAQFYRFSLDENRYGSFAQKLAQTEDEINGIFSKLEPEYQERIKETNDVILTTSFCYYSEVQERIATGRDCDDTGCNTEYDTFSFLSFYKHTYVFEKNDQGEVSDVNEWNEYLGDYDDLQGRDPLESFKYDFGGECEKIIPGGGATKAEILESKDVKRLEVLFYNRNMLRELKKLGHLMETQIIDEMKNRGMIEQDSSEAGLNSKVEFLGKKVVR